MNGPAHDARTPAEELGNDLRDAFGALGTASVTPEQRATFQRRLLAITTASKRDVQRARKQLTRFWNDLRAADAVNNMNEDE